jgi:hypothetical protein
MFMSRNGKLRFWIEVALASLTGALTILTLLSHEWIELVFGVEPDGGDGSLEWAIVGVLLLTTVVFAVLARSEWQRSRSPQT